MKEVIEQRFNELITQGAVLSSKAKEDDYWIIDSYIPLFQTWLSSSINLIQMISPKQSFHFNECNKIMEHEQLNQGIPTLVFQRMFGLIASAFEEWKRGILKDIQYIVAAETFDDFLDHAFEYHKANKKNEAAILASSVLEDTIKKIATKNNITTKGVSLEPLIESLISSDILTVVKGKRIKAYAGIRNKALHAEWDEFDIRDTGEMIKGIRELIENYL
ncbi:hypothetical protein J40TS1_31470 [Paenibacillus montaniterrae]|uniref:DUF4145 domain-containing protein n=1 Tax=Paenibacillus montaniterrae TaxID=429341 RepID=A0A919YPX0_9BACL|nr:hypothetical protein [Paenibacillus montaniterrae]GIP17505.1 hypothetical protein J40TS1_31470 [Paenibacillus montaniterrae]